MLALLGRLRTAAAVFLVIAVTISASRCVRNGPPACEQQPPFYLKGTAFDCAAARRSAENQTEGANP
jgi:hypothetical protein